MAGPFILEENLTDGAYKNFLYNEQTPCLEDCYVIRKEPKSSVPPFHSQSCVRLWWRRAIHFTFQLGNYVLLIKHMHTEHFCLRILSQFPKSYSFLSGHLTYTSWIVKLTSAISLASWTYKLIHKNGTQLLKTVPKSKGTNGVSCWRIKVRCVCVCRCGFVNWMWM